MILVETSVLIQVQRQPNSKEAIELASLLTSGEAAITGPIIMEYIRGARTDEELSFLVTRLSSIDYLDMDRQAWIIAGRLNNWLIRSGDRLTNVDIAIAATAIRHDVPLYTLDKGFERVAELTLYEPTKS